MESGRVELYLCFWDAEITVPVTASPADYHPSEKIPPSDTQSSIVYLDGGNLAHFFEMRKDTRMPPGRDPTQFPASIFYENTHELGLCVDALSRRVSLLMK